ncbi:MAG: methyltransferase domain-containing protein [Algoriphagus sp.]|uniref:methyltransferase domain-containing protein n=1 Tax=Algoriphagus sp. TaxID=1872435 RepID=UPI0017FC5BDE|nr:methyltransferase domain-containing protein [Algoriphagus sp.]NVJ86760.1 methyltransferase domain-containing protein [Algoriphagus sp.]
MIDQYKSGSYFIDNKRHFEDSNYKVRAIWRLLKPIVSKEGISINSYADVGCGSGGVVSGLSNLLKKSGIQLSEICGFDVSPHVRNLKFDKISFYEKDFVEHGKRFDLVTLTDVFEHVTAPMDFIRRIGSLAGLVVFHVPLDDCLAVNMRNLQRSKIKNPGHLVFLNVNSALNLITNAGYKIIDYDYSRETLTAPSNVASILQKIFFPIKFIFFKISPWLMSRIFGFSLVVVAKLDQ